MPAFEAPQVQPSIDAAEIRAETVARPSMRPFRGSTATSGASSRAGKRRTSRSAAHVRSGNRLYPEMQSAHACMTGRRFSSRSSRAYAATVAEPSTCASANSESSSSTSCSRAQPLKLDRNP